ncbi:DNA adenine methylase [Pseudomonas frederiksbergensis]|jgi:DNA adenine methylase|uniref:Site-specific DNA-methyltransferase (adenine-specific) n=1 Tax=Pseudomonas frederiksbergensis TaxID=104087 RepID=A0A0B1Z4Y4_9PSED|nr:Dam family site-specific DNA-(adenine-N6)-methyltransferase [Pseudomonas frederiksbergensis]KHK64251.1 DNA methyltransferase [Pseudomonas frederiksbergensis]
MKAEQQIDKVDPFLKWAGGKRWLVKARPDIFPCVVNNYYEPFLGGGAVFFHIAPKNSTLSDKNPALINLYLQIKEDWKTLKNELTKHQLLHSKEYYYKIRSTTYQSNEEQAAQFLYLNRTCFNGLFRVNLKGEFNVPIGTKSSVIFPEEDFEKIAQKLKNSKIITSDFEEVIDKAMLNDLVFADPPYTVKHNNNGFVKYNESIFSWEDQERLARALLRAAKRGAHIISTNANHPSVKALYEKNFTITILDRSSVLAGKKSARGGTTEILIMNRDKFLTDFETH